MPLSLFFLHLQRIFNDARFVIMRLSFSLALILLFYSSAMAQKCDSVSVELKDTTIKVKPTKLKPLKEAENYVRPEYPGGREECTRFIKHFMQYPADAVTAHKEGKVKVVFFVEKDGSLSDIHVVTPVYPSLDNEALRVAKMMPQWIPGSVNGETKRIRTSITVNFRLPKNK